MAEGIQIRVVRDDVSPHIKKLAQLAGSLKKPLTEIGRNLVASTKMRFARSEGPVGGLGPVKAWAPLKEGTVARRRGGGEGAKPLLDTGMLMRSVQSKAEDRELHVGTNHQIAPGVTAAIHQLGGTSGMAPGPAAIPARAFLGVDDDDAKAIEHVVSAYLGAAA